MKSNQRTGLIKVGGLIVEGGLIYQTIRYFGGTTERVPTPQITSHDKDCQLYRFNIHLCCVHTLIA